MAQAGSARCICELRDLSNCYTSPPRMMPRLSLLRKNAQILINIGTGTDPVKSCGGGVGITIFILIIYKWPYDSGWCSSWLHLLPSSLVQQWLKDQPRSRHPCYRRRSLNTPAAKMPQAGQFPQHVSGLHIHCAASPTPCYLRQWVQ